VIRVAFDVRVEVDAFVLEARDDAAVEVLGLFGHSGSGKTTLLETLAGLRRPARGEIRVGEGVLFSSSNGIDIPPHDRRIGYVPQDALLFPHLSVRGNIEYARGRAPWPFPRTVPAHRPTGTQDTRTGPAPSQGMRTRPAPVVEMLELGSLLGRRVTGLSGGEKQRVAIGRALMASPQLLLLDEPLAAVDREQRDRILPYLLRIRRELHVPMIYVTHDAAELRQIADRVLVLSEGRVQRAGAPSDALGPGMSQR
jgi:molybdate transport system ATP-binding protein